METSDMNRGGEGMAAKKQGKVRLEAFVRPDQEAAIRAIAERDDRPISRVMRRVIDFYLKHELPVAE